MVTSCPDTYQIISLVSREAALKFKVTCGSAIDILEVINKKSQVGGSKQYTHIKSCSSEGKILCSRLMFAHSFRPSQWQNGSVYERAIKCKRSESTSRKQVLGIVTALRLKGLWILWLGFPRCKSLELKKNTFELVISSDLWLLCHR